MLSSKFLKDIMSEAYPIIKRQLEDAEVISSFRELVTANGGDWSALKALMKAHVEDSLDDSGEGKRVKKILEKADSSNAYAGMLGLSNMNEKNSIADDDQADQAKVEDPEVTAQKARLAELRAHPAIVSVDKLKSQSQPLNQAGQTEAAPAAATSPVESEAVEISTPIQPETANENPVAHEVERPVKAKEDAKRLEGNVQPEGAAKNLVTMPERTAVQAPAGSQPQACKSVEAPASAALASKYAPKGAITWQHTPPEGVLRHDYSVAFGEAGQDIAVIEDDVMNASSAPIVMIGNVILDGWARYMKARELGIEYPAVQYDGSDSLMDVIKWNVGGRLMSSEQTFRIAQKLSRAEPKRKADIYAAFELGMELA